MDQSQTVAKAVPSDREVHQRNENKAIQGFLICYVIVMSMLYYIFRYKPRSEKVLTQSEYLTKLSELGYDISNPDKAIEAAQTKVAALKSTLAKARSDSTMYFSCPGLCTTSTNYYRCCNRKRDIAQDKAERTAIEALPKEDQDLLEYHNGYNDQNYKMYSFTEYFIGTYIAIPLLCLIVFGGFLRPGF